MGGLLDPDVVKIDNKEKLQSTTQDAISKMSEYASKRRMMNLGMIKTEIDYKIRELELKKKARDQDLRRQAQHKALAQGEDITLLDFFDPAVLSRFINLETSSLSESHS